MKIITFNARSWGNWSEEYDKQNSFINRLGMIHESMANEKADVIAFQEVTEDMIPYLENAMPGYIFFGHGRGEDYTGEGLYIAIRKETTRILGLKSFWIAPDINNPKSKYADQSLCPRICVNAKIQDIASKKIFLVYNVHLDHVGKKARSEGIQCVLDIAKSDAGTDKLPICILGDFNAEPDSDVCEMCNSDKELKIKDVTDKIECTFHDYGRDSEKIDYIYLSEKLAESVKNVRALKDCRYGIYISDHYPVAAEFEL